MLAVKSGAAAAERDRRRSSAAKQVYEDRATRSHTRHCRRSPWRLQHQQTTREEAARGREGAG